MTDKLGRRIIELRTSKNITQEQLAENVGVTRQAISKWERGEGFPDLYNITTLASVLGVTVDDLVEGNEQGKMKFSNNQNKHSNQLNGGYLKRLLYKAKNTTNSAEAKKIKKILLIVGGIGFTIGIIMVVSGFSGFANGAFSSVNNFGNNPFGDYRPFNPIPHMILFLAGGVVSGVSVFILYGGLTIAIAGVASNYLDTRRKCPSCGDEVDADEKICSNCGFSLLVDLECSQCGKINQASDKFCRECGNSLKNK